MAYWTGTPWSRVTDLLIDNRRLPWAMRAGKGGNSDCRVRPCWPVIYRRGVTASAGWHCTFASGAGGNSTPGIFHPFQTTELIYSLLRTADSYFHTYCIVAINLISQRKSIHSSHAWPSRTIMIKLSRSYLVECRKSILLKWWLFSSDVQDSVAVCIFHFLITCTLHLKGLLK